MKNSLNLIYLILIIAVVGFSSCNEDDPPVVITFPDTGVIPELAFGETMNFVFTVEAEGGYKSHTLDGSLGITSANPISPEEGATNFTISGAFTANDTEAGLGGIYLLVTDLKGTSAQATMPVTIVE